MQYVARVSKIHVIEVEEMSIPLKKTTMYMMKSHTNTVRTTMVKDHRRKKFSWEK